MPKNLLKNLYYSIGLMSGTSMDKIDGVLAETNGENYFNVIAKSSLKYKKKTVQNLKYFINNHHLAEGKSLKRKNLYNNVTIEHISVIDDLISKTNLKPSVIGFHGQTIYHNSKKKISIQVGIPELIKKKFNIDVISNFRRNDIKNGGEGAPISPIYHKFLIDKFKLPIPCCFINIGGVANLTYYDGSCLIGFDTGPGNGLMDIYCNKNLNIPFDKNGDLASKGKVNKNLVLQFCKNEFFSKSYPKSLDKFTFSDFLLNEDFTSLNNNDALATLNEITVQTILKSLTILPEKPSLIVMMGGGVKNLCLVNNLKSKNSCKLINSDEIGINSEYAESEMIAYLAVRKLRNLQGSFPTTTGVYRPVVLGEIY